jgi:hypothetical protein
MRSSRTLEAYTLDPPCRNFVEDIGSPAAAFRQPYAARPYHITVISLDGESASPYLPQMACRPPAPDGLLVRMPVKEDWPASHFQFGQGLP